MLPGTSNHVKSPSAMKSGSYLGKQGIQIRIIERERERELRREGGKSLLAYVKGAGPYLI